MPLFTWANPVIITSRFWLYWAVTIPLTIIVLAIWTCYLLWISALQRKEEKIIQTENIIIEPKTDDCEDTRRTTNPLLTLLSQIRGKESGTSA
jgi:hypothetical protein